MPFVRTRDGQSLHYYDLGPRHAPPVVILHGFGMHGGMWLPQALPLARRNRVILPDLRGFGRSHRLPLADTTIVRQHASDVDDLFRALDLRGVALAGLSMGACTALELHRTYGFERVARYLHIDQSPCIDNDGDWQHGLLGLDQATRLESWRALLYELLPHRDTPLHALRTDLGTRLRNVMVEFFDYAFHLPALRRLATLARHERVFRHLLPTSNWSIHLDTLRSYLEAGYDWRPSVPDIDVPVTLHVGVESRMYPAAGQLWMASVLRRAEVVRFEGAGHSLPFEAPAKFGRELLRFARGG